MKNFSKNTEPLNVLLFDTDINQAYTDSAHSTPVLLHSFMSVGIVVTSVAAAFISFSSTNLAAVGALASGRKSMEFYEPCTNLHVNF